ASYRPLDRLMEESDWIVPALPVSPPTRGLIGREQFAHVKPGAILVNVTRPDAVERDALIEALRSGRLGGLGLDVQYEAPGRDDDELLTFANVALSPHLAAQPRFNALDDLSDLCAQVAEVLSK